MEVWKRSFQSFDKEKSLVEESLLGLANGQLQSRAYFAEGLTGSGKRKAYIPPFALSDWAGLELDVDGERLDLSKAKVESYIHELDMKEGHVKRRVQVRLSNKHSLLLESTHFCAREKAEILGLRYSITPLNMPASLQLSLFLQAPTERAWQEVSRQNQSNEGYMLLKRGEVYICSGMRYAIFQDAYKLDCNPKSDSGPGCIRHNISLSLPKGSQTTIYKFTSHFSSEEYPPEKLLPRCQRSLSEVFGKGFTILLSEQAESWRKWWKKQAISLEAPPAEQLHLHYTLFQLEQLSGLTQTQLAGRVFSPEQQKGQSWEQEAFLLPYYLWQGKYQMARQLLDTRYEELQGAHQIATELGFSNGSALYPSISWQGRETQTDTRLAQQQLFRNGMIAWAIHRFKEHTGQTSFLAEKGAEILVGISRFFAERVNYSPGKQAYVLLGVIGPDAYEQNVANNWLSNYLLQWTLQYTVEVLQWLREEEAVRYAALIGKTDLDFSAETRNWERIAGNLYFPEYPKIGLFLQQEGFLDKNQLEELSESQLPLWQNWTEDRRVRSVFLQQADLLWVFYLFPDKFKNEQIRTHLEFYAAKTVHEAPLSSGLHSILASQLGQFEDARSLQKNDQEALTNPLILQHRGGLHVPALAGPYLRLVLGLARPRIKEEICSIQPHLPPDWQSYSLKLYWQNHAIQLRVSAEKIQVKNLQEEEVSFQLYGETLSLSNKSTLSRKTKSSG